MLHTTSSVDFKGIMLSEKSQSHKAAYAMIRFMYQTTTTILSNNNITDMENKILVAKG